MANRRLNQARARLDELNARERAVKAALSSLSEENMTANAETRRAEKAAQIRKEYAGQSAEIQKAYEIEWRGDEARIDHLEKEIELLYEKQRITLDGADPETASLIRLKTETEVLKLRKEQWELQDKIDKQDEAARTSELQSSGMTGFDYFLSEDFAGDRVVGGPSRRGQSPETTRR